MTVPVVIGGSKDIGQFMAQRFGASDDDVVITSSSPSTAEEVAKSTGGSTGGIALDLSRPATIEDPWKKCC
jgi:NAD(P)-dependent dehydrogenase (short-subunit alcohol dehydrogenase family)